MKNSFYFDHDYNARNDQKILEVRAEFGWEGYAIFFALLECLCESKGYIKREALAGLSLGLNLTKDKLNEYLCFYIKIDLFCENENGIFSKRVLDHLAYRERLSAAGARGGRGNKKEEKPPFSNPLATQEAVKESKEEESKEEVIKFKYVYSKFYDEELQRSNNDQSYLKFIKFLFGENELSRPLTSVLKLKDQMKYDQFLKLREQSMKFNVNIYPTILNLENSKRCKDYSVLYTTLKNWITPKK